MSSFRSSRVNRPSIILMLFPVRIFVFTIILFISASTICVFISSSALETVPFPQLSSVELRHCFKRETIWLSPVASIPNCRKISDCRVISTRSRTIFNLGPDADHFVCRLLLPQPRRIYRSRITSSASIRPSKFDQIKFLSCTFKNDRLCSALQPKLQFTRLQYASSHAALFQ